MRSTVVTTVVGCRSMCTLPYGFFDLTKSDASMHLTDDFCDSVSDERRSLLLHCSGGVYADLTDYFVTPERA